MLTRLPCGSHLPPLLARSFVHLIPICLSHHPQVFPVEYADQSALCSLASHAVHALAAAAMEGFEAAGPPDPAASVEPLAALLGHPYVEMGGDMVRSWVFKFLAKRAGVLFIINAKNAKAWCPLVTP